MNRSKLRVQLLELESERRKFERLLQVATPAALSGLPASLFPKGATHPSSKSSTDEPPINAPQSIASAASGDVPQHVAQADSSESLSSGNAPLPASPASTASAATAAAPTRRHAPAPPRRPLPRPAPFEQADPEPRHYGPALGPFAQRASSAPWSIEPLSSEQLAAAPSRRIDIPVVSARDDAGLYEESPEFE